MEYSVPAENRFTPLGFSSDQDSEVGYEGSGEGDFDAKGKGEILVGLNHMLNLIMPRWKINFF